VRLDATVSVSVDGAGELQHLTGAGAPGPCWWNDGHGVTWVRLPEQRAATVVIRTAS